MRITVLLTLLPLLTACNRQKSSALASAAETVHAIEVQVGQVSQGPPGHAYSAPSTLTVEHEADLLAEEEGRLLEVLADEGQRVKRGQVLAQTDDARLRKQLDQDHAARKSLEVKVQEGEVLREGAEVELQRQSELHKAGLGNLRDFDRARFNLAALRQEVESARFELERANHKVEEDELRLSRMELRTPFDGIVSRRYARIGQMLLKNDKVLRVTEMRPLLVRFMVPEAVRGVVGAGASVEVIPAGQASRVRARVIRTSYVVDAASGSLECTAQLVGPVPAHLVPGMAVEIKVPGPVAESAIRIPASAVLRRPDGKAEVFLVVADHLARRSVQLGPETAAGVQVLRGLRPGDRVALNVSDKMEDGLAVRVRP